MSCFLQSTTTTGGTRSDGMASHRRRLTRLRRRSKRRCRRSLRCSRTCSSISPPCCRRACCASTTSPSLACCRSDHSVLSYPTFLVAPDQQNRHVRSTSRQTGARTTPVISWGICMPLDKHYAITDSLVGPAQPCSMRGHEERE